MAYSSWSVVFGEQPSAAKWNILGTNDSSFNDGTGIANAAIKPNHLIATASTLNTHVWDSYTPTFANTTLGNGSMVGKYIQIGKTVFFRASFILGTTSAMGTGATVTLPITSVALDTTQPIGIVVMNDSDTSRYEGVLIWTTTTTAGIRLSTVIGGVGTYVRLDATSSTTPFAWGTADELHIQGSYEVA